MKTNLLLILSFILISLSSKAQEKTYTETVDSIYHNLNKAEITTSILYDRVFPFANIDYFNYINPDTSNYEYFKQAYFELYTASYNNMAMFHPDAFEKFAQLQTLNNVTPIALLNYNFNVIDTLALDDNLMYNNDLLLYDVNNRTRNPYLLKNVTVASVMADSVYSSTVNFKLFSNTYLQNTALSIASLQVDFDDGLGLRTVSVNQLIAINYFMSGLKTLKYIITYSNAQTVTTYSSLHVNYNDGYSSRAGVTNAKSPTCNGIGNPENIDIEADNAYQGYEESVGFKGQGLATIYYHNNDCDRVIKKPVIIIDGFDPGSTTFAPDLLKYLKYNNGVIPDANLAEELIAQGYDVIVLDFPKYPINGNIIDGGSDYIQRNAFTLVKLIQQINTIKASYADSLIIIGPSMGGLISRYALTYMEQHNMPHKTKLWMSFDVPHLGANIPIGDQWCLDYLGNTLGKKMQKQN